MGHDGGHGGGEHAFTLVVTDRVTQWTELRAVLNKAQKWVFQALLWIRAVLPFLLHALHTDSGSEFINHHLTRYCLQQQIRFTRSRPQRKNDNNFTEQKNYDVVRKHVGYLRLESEQEVELLNQLYDVPDNRKAATRERTQVIGSSATSSGSECMKKGGVL